MPWTISNLCVLIYSGFVLSQDRTFAAKPRINEKQLPGRIGNLRSKH
ncbi:hypothetical protein FHW68_003920 [Pseudomonas sp. Tn43]|nr:hypothetical protein [Pseudomonas sp. Tn43]